MIIMVEYKKLNKEWKLELEWEQELEQELDSLKKKIRREND